LLKNMQAAENRARQGGKPANEGAYFLYVTEIAGVANAASKIAPQFCGCTTFSTAWGIVYGSFFTILFLYSIGLWLRYL
jgi:hypothetical protein